MGFFWAAHGWGGRGKNVPPSLKSVTLILQSWTLAQLYYTQKRSQKYINHVIHPLNYADISNFSPEISKFCYIKKCMYRLHIDTKFLIILTFLESLKIALMKKVIILMMPAKVTTPDLLKTKVFWNKDYDVTNKILSRDSNYIVDVVIRPKFGNSNISIREVIIVSI